MLAGVKQRGAKSVFIRYLTSLDGYPHADAVLAAITCTLAWGPLMRKRISRLTAESLPWWVRLFGALIGAWSPRIGTSRTDSAGSPLRKFWDSGRSPRWLTLRCWGYRLRPLNLFAFQTLVGLLLTTVRAQSRRKAQRRGLRRRPRNA